MSIFTLEGNIINQISSKLDDMWNARGVYNMVYVSIGGKIIEPHVYFNSPNKKANTNAKNQIIPTFLRYRSEEQFILIIAIDDFRSEQQLRMNETIINERVDENMDVLIINNYCTKPFLAEFVSILSMKLLIHNIHETNFMICNFVKFLNNPNAVESMAESMIPTTIQHILDRPEYFKYSYCFYEWFGYRYYLYNFIYNYKKCLTTFTANSYINELEMFMKSQYNDNMKSTAVVQNINTLLFWESIYDITSTTSGRHGIATNFTNYLLENDQLLSSIIQTQTPSTMRIIVEGV